MNELIETLDLYFHKKAPKLPTGGKEFIVKVAPYLAVLSAIVGGLGLLVLIGFSPLAAQIGYMAGRNYGVMYSLFIALSIIGFILNLLSIKGLFARNESGWNYTFYSVLLGGVSNLINKDILGLIIGLVIGFYILFQVKDYYFGITKVGDQKNSSGSTDEKIRDAEVK